MANRSYLYSTDHPPGAEPVGMPHQAKGIAEWNYDIPLVFKLLVSGKVTVSRSAIWPDAGEIALMGGYDEGVVRLDAFLERITLAEAQPLVEQAKAFLKASTNRGQYFLLEPGEILEMNDEPLAQQNLQLHDSIRKMDAEVEAALETLTILPRAARAPQGFLARVFGRTPRAREPAVDPLASVRSVGLGHWSNQLYYTLDHSGAASEALGK
ncbi:hypothetical protein AVHY2522_05875 [Acidovorax sp. SUPP2522]|uniref:DUF7822 domain-containing protein n=1 Tax=unclassified Acidovorax TaxID=2684926 RepID=UPI00234B40D9|nr:MULTISPECIES: hypothetical protein [unclassified Acidovorax]WCM99822.1 hypothetical protein M5C96_10730 [Acidovorax sp. GBBC 1281]GKT14793.1 hypothetical protein AVHY2522_05875 [Acidovorax sp. SUPP2522]